MGNKVVAQGQLTIVDLHDRPPLQGRLTSNLPKIVVGERDGSKQNPDWVSNNLEVGVELFSAGTQEDLVDSGKKEIEGIDWFFTLGTQKESGHRPEGVTLKKSGNSKYNNRAVINRRLLNDKVLSLKVRAVVKYRYPLDEVSLPVSMEIDFGLVLNGKEGENAYTAMLTNTSQGIPCDKDGKVVRETRIKTSAIVYHGTELQKDFSVGLKKGENLPSGVRLETTSDKRSVIFIISKGASLGAESGEIVLEAVLKNKSFPLVFSWSKINGGEDATSYTLIRNTPVIVRKWKESKFIFDPPQIEVKAMYQNGEKDPKDYKGRFKLEVYNEKHILSEFSSVSSQDELSRKLVLPEKTDFTHIKLTLCKAGSNNLILDEEEIRIVEEPKKPVVVSVSSEKDTLRNSSGEAILKVKVYRDGKDITEKANKNWTSGVSNTSLGTGSTLTVTPLMVNTSEVFKCKVTIDGDEYYDSIVIYDTTDPLQITIYSSNGNTFKNEKGKTILTCQLWKNKEVEDEEGIKYGYCWHKIDDNGIEFEEWGPVLPNKPSYSKKSPSVATVTKNSNGSTLYIDSNEFLRQSYFVFVGTNTTPYQIIKNSGATTVTLDKNITVTEGTKIYLPSMKSIYVDQSEIDEKATFVCEILE